jgi:hypothetical protein
LSYGAAFEELITRPRSHTVCKMTMKLRNQPYAPKWEQEEMKKMGLGQ